MYFMRCGKAAVYQTSRRNGCITDGQICINLTKYNHVISSYHRMNQEAIKINLIGACVTLKFNIDIVLLS